MKSASMGKKFIPSSRRGNSRSQTPCSRPFAQSCEWLKPALRSQQFLGRHLRFTIYDLRSARDRLCLLPFCKRRSQIVNRNFLGRVMGAWWPSRSSKPLLARFTGRGVFDSLPLRHSDLRFRASLGIDLGGYSSSSFVLALDFPAFFRGRGRGTRTRRTSLPVLVTRFLDRQSFAALVNRKSPIANPKGGEPHVPRTNS